MASSWAWSKLPSSECEDEEEENEHGSLFEGSRSSMSEGRKGKARSSPVLVRLGRSSVRPVAAF
eukprot:5613210-Heterocapsa_arctica.AAC.1